MTEDEQEEMFRLRAENVVLRQRISAQPAVIWIHGGVWRQNGSGIQKQIPWRASDKASMT